MKFGKLAEKDANSKVLVIFLFCFYYIFPIAQKSFNNTEETQKLNFKVFNKYLPVPLQCIIIPKSKKKM